MTFSYEGKEIEIKVSQETRDEIFKIAMSDMPVKRFSGTNTGGHPFIIDVGRKCVAIRTYSEKLPQK